MSKQQKPQGAQNQQDQKRKPGRPAGDPWEQPLNVSPEALAQAVLRPPKPKDDKK